MENSNSTRSLRPFMTRAHWDKLSSNDLARVASNVKTKPIRYLFRKYFPYGELSLIAGASFTGKSTMMCWIIAEFLRENPGMFAMIISTEDNFANVIVPHLIAAGADIERVINGEGCKFYTEPSMGPICRPNDLEAFTIRMSRQFGQVGMIAIDPLTQVVDGDFNNGSKARATYEALAGFAERFDIAVLGICHLLKITKGKAPLARIAGPGAVTQVPRFIMMTVKNSEPQPDGGTHTMLHVKTVIGKLQSADSYSIVGCKYFNGAGEIETSKIEFCGVIDGTPEEILSRIEGTTADKKIDAVNEAVIFLKDTLKDGALSKPEILKLAELSGISNASIERARKQLRIQCEKQKGIPFGPFIWSLPKVSD